METNVEAEKWREMYISLLKQQVRESLVRIGGHYVNRIYLFSVNDTLERYDRRTHRLSYERYCS